MRTLPRIAILKPLHRHGKLQKAMRPNPVAHVQTVANWLETNDQGSSGGGNFNDHIPPWFMSLPIDYLVSEPLESEATATFLKISKRWRALDESAWKRCRLKTVISVLKVAYESYPSAIKPALDIHTSALLRQSINSMEWLSVEDTLVQSTFDWGSATYISSAAFHAACAAATSARAGYFAALYDEIVGNMSADDIITAEAIFVALNAIADASNAAYTLLLSFAKSMPQVSNNTSFNWTEERRSLVDSACSSIKVAKAAAKSAEVTARAAKYNGFVWGVGVTASVITKIAQEVESLIDHQKEVHGPETLLIYLKTSMDLTLKAWGDATTDDSSVGAAAGESIDTQLAIERAISAASGSAYDECALSLGYRNGHGLSESDHTLALKAYERAEIGAREQVRKVCLDAIEFELGTIRTL
jgi:hypothetical protein